MCILFLADFDVASIDHTALLSCVSLFGEDYIRAYVPRLPVGGFPWLLGDRHRPWDKHLCIANSSALNRPLTHICKREVGTCQMIRDQFAWGDVPPALSFYLLCHYFSAHVRRDFVPGPNGPSRPSSYLLFFFIHETSFLSLVKTYLLPALILK